MTAYIIADVTVTDPKQFAEYHRLSGAAFEAHGIKPLAAVGTTERLEGRDRDSSSCCLSIRWTPQGLSAPWMDWFR